MRDCKNCKHLIMYDYKNKSYSCEKWECKFEPKEQEPTTKNDSRFDWESYKDVDGNCLDDLILEVLQNNFDCGNTYGYKVADEIIGLLPSMTPQEQKTGHWIETHDDWGNGIITDRKYKCSVCHGKHIDPEMGEWHEVFDYKYPFCPNCGVKMAETEGQE